MNKSLIQDFALRVTQASRSELVVITYDIILTDIHAARDIFTTKDMSSEVVIEEYRKELKHAGRFMNELMATLDYHFVLSYELRRLYVFANGEIIRAAMSRNLEPLIAVEAMIRKLRDAFVEVAAADTSGPIMKNTQKLTAGLTYGKSALNEICVNANDSQRGYRA